MKRRTLITIIALLLFTGCSTVQVSQDYKPGINFSRYHTYQWKMRAGQPSDDIRLNSPLLHDRFRQAIDRILVQRGYAQGLPADFRVSYTYSVQTRLESYPFGSSIGMGFGRYHRYGELGFDDNWSIRQYTVGILAIDFYDVVSGALIWRGIGSERIGMHSTPEDTTAFVNRMVNAVLVQFPPR